MERLSKYVNVLYLSETEESFASHVIIAKLEFVCIITIL